MAGAEKGNGFGGRVVRRSKSSNKECPVPFELQINNEFLISCDVSHSQNVRIVDPKFEVNWTSCILSGIPSMGVPEEAGRKASRGKGQWHSCPSFPSPTHTRTCSQGTGGWGLTPTPGKEMSMTILLSFRRHGQNH